MASRPDIQAGRAFVELTLRDGLTKGLKAAGKNLKSFGTGVAMIGATISAAGAGIIGPLTAAVHKFAASGDQIGKMAKRTGVSTEALSELGFAAQQSGQDIEVLENTLKKMQKTVGGAMGGAGESIDALRDIGVTVSQLKGLSPDQQFEVIAEAISKIPDPTERASAAIKIFGRSGTALIPLMLNGAAGIRALRKEANELGLTKSAGAAKMGEDLTDAFNRISRTTGAVWSKIGSAIAEPVLGATRVITRILVTVGKWVVANKRLVVTIAGIGGVLLVAGAAFTALGLTIFTAGIALTGFASLIGGVSAMLGLVFSPIGLITAALIGAGVAWAGWTQSGQAAVNGITGFLTPLLETFRSTFAGIADAITAGDLGLAGTIAMAGLKLAMLQGVAGISSAVGGEWGDFIGKLGTQILSGDLSGAWSTVVKGIYSVWSGFCEGIVAVFTTAGREIIDWWQSIVTFLTNLLLKLDALLGGTMAEQQARAEQNRLEQLGADRELLQKEEGNLKEAEAHGGTRTWSSKFGPRDIETGQPISQTETAEEIRARIDRVKQQIKRRELERPDVLSDAQDLAAQSIKTSADRGRKFLDQLDANAQQRNRDSASALHHQTAGGSNASTDAVSKAQAELDAARAKAAAAAAKARTEDEARKPTTPGAGGDLGANLKGQVFGTFSAAALQAGGGQGSVVEKLTDIAATAKEQLERLDRIADRDEMLLTDPSATFS